MGSVTKPPSPPPQPVYYYVPAPAPAPSPAPVLPSENDSAGPAQPTPAEQKQSREQSLLRRDRGRLGTIISGFRGILGLSNDTPARKTLLGE